jgi:hypothetical protein
MIYYDIVTMSSEIIIIIIIQSVASDIIMMNFEHANFIFSQIFIFTTLRII